jgi:putative oxidoreductase
MTVAGPSSTADRLDAIVRVIVAWVGRFGSAAAPPAARIALALPFLRSGLTRWDGFLSISASTQYLFEQQFKLHVFGKLYDFPSPDVLAFLVATAEIALPALLLIGLATRLSALGLLVMTGVIQLVFPDGWMNFHLYWAALALAVMALGPGPLSLDHLLRHILVESRGVRANGG